MSATDDHWSALRKPHRWHVTVGVRRLSAQIHYDYVLNVSVTARSRGEAERLAEDATRDQTGLHTEAQFVHDEGEVSE